MRRTQRQRGRRKLDSQKIQKNEENQIVKKIQNPPEKEDKSDISRSDPGSSPEEDNPVLTETHRQLAHMKGNPPQDTNQQPKKNERNVTLTDRDQSSNRAVPQFKLIQLRHKDR